MRREEESSGHRHARLQGIVLDELRALLRDDVSDPALADVRVTAAVLSVDYRHARVHFTLRKPAPAHVNANANANANANQDIDGRAAMRGLARAAPFLRARLADAVEMKRVPDLRFVFDGVVPDDGAPDADA